MQEKLKVEWLQGKSRWRKPFGHSTSFISSMNKTGYCKVIFCIKQSFENYFGPSFWVQLRWAWTQSQTQKILSCQTCQMFQALPLDLVSEYSKQHCFLDSCRTVSRESEEVRKILSKMRKGRTQKLDRTMVCKMCVFTCFGGLANQHFYCTTVYSKKRLCCP